MLVDANSNMRQKMHKCKGNHILHENHMATLLGLFYCVCLLLRFFIVVLLLCFCFIVCVCLACFCLMLVCGCGGWFVWVVCGFVLRAWFLCVCMCLFVGLCVLQGQHNMCFPLHL